MDKTKNISDIPEWFSGSRLNFAENLLKYDDEKVAIYSTGKYGRIAIYSHVDIFEELCILQVDNYGCRAVYSKGR